MKLHRCCLGGCRAKDCEVIACARAASLHRNRIIENQLASTSVKETS